MASKVEPGQWYQAQYIRALERLSQQKDEIEQLKANLQFQKTATKNISAALGHVQTTNNRAWQELKELCERHILD